jgi:hypothetical protein
MMNFPGFCNKFPSTSTHCRLCFPTDSKSHFIAPQSHQFNAFIIKINAINYSSSTESFFEWLIEEIARVYF